MAGPMQVTATQGTSPSNGILLRVKVLNGVASSPLGNSGSYGAISGPAAASVTTTVTGSMVYGALTCCPTTALTAQAGTTLLDSHQDVPNANWYSTFQTSSVTGTPGATTVGASAPTATCAYSCAAIEILSAGTIQDDASAPAVAVTDSATTITSAVFSPPDGALMLALVSSDATNGSITMAVSGGGVSWTELVSGVSSNGNYSGVWAAIAGTTAPGDPLITCTETGSTSTGIAARIKVLTGAAPAASQTGATATQSALGAHQASITTTQTGSIVYGALIDGNNTSFTADASTTLFDNLADAANTIRYGTLRTTAATGTPGAVTVGASAPATDVGGCALAEILPATPGGTINEDVSSPASVEVTGSITLQVNVLPPPGSLLVLMVASDGSSGVVSMTVSGGGLTWTALAEAHATGDQYAGVWIAQIPGETSAVPALPGRTWRRLFHHPQAARLALPAAPAAPAVPPVLRGSPVRAQAAAAPGGHVTRRAGTPQATGPALKAPAGPVQARRLPARGGSVTSRSGLFAGTGPAFRAATGPVRARVPQPRTGGQAATRRGPYGGLGPALKALAAAVAGRLRGLPPRGRTATRAGTAGPAGPAVRPATGPVRAQPAPARGGHAATRAGTFTAAAPQTGPPVYPLRGPVQSRQQPQRGGHVSRAAGPYDGTGPQLRPAEGPLRAQPAARRGGTVQSRSGTFTFVSLTSGPPVYPLHGPVQARRLPQRGGSTSSRTGALGRTGAPVKPLPAPVQAKPGPQRGGRAASRSGTFTAVSLTTGPPLYPLGHPAQARRLPARGGSASHRAGPQQGTGPAVPALKQPLGIYRQQPPPPVRGRVLSLDGVRSGTGPPVPPLHRPVRGQPAKPVLTGRVASRAGTYTFIPPPAFTIGTLTASGAPGSTLTAGQSASALTAATAGTAALTAATQTTGGPS